MSIKNLVQNELCSHLKSFVRNICDLGSIVAQTASEPTLLIMNIVLLIQVFMWLQFVACMLLPIACRPLTTD